MAITGVSNYATYTAQKSSSETSKNKTETQATRKTYSNASEYRTYLTKKYDCLKSSDYSVTINSSLLTDLKKMFKRLLMI